jgi:putative glycosyltransferase
MRVSVVTSLYNSAPYIEEFYRRCVSAIAPFSSEIEFVFVDDGSPDRSFQVTRGLFHCPHTITVVQLSRNYGAMRAMMVGIAQATGDLVFLLDSDLEEPPELFAKLYEAMELQGEEAVDVAYAVQLKRKGGVFERISGELFYRLFNYLSSVDVPRNCMVCRLMTRRYVRALASHCETEIFFEGLSVLTGFRQVAVPGEKKHKGSSAYSLRRRITISLDAVISFSTRPLFLIFAIGVTVSAVSFVYMCYLLFKILFLGYSYAPGWSSILLAVSFFGGLTLSALGVVGLYIGRILLEVKRRPCIIQSIMNNGVSS